MTANPSVQPAASFHKRILTRPARALESGKVGVAVEVEIQSVSGCARCAQGRGCGAGIFNQGVAPVRMQCTAQCPVVEGQQLQIEFDEGGSHWLWLVTGAYGLPTAGLMLAAIIASLALPDASSPPSTSAAMRDLMVAGAALVGLAGGVIAWRMMAPGLLKHLEKRLGLHSGRIVAAGSAAKASAVLSRSTCSTPENS